MSDEQFAELKSLLERLCVGVEFLIGKEKLAAKNVIGGNPANEGRRILDGEIQKRRAPHSD